MPNADDFTVDLVTPDGQRIALRGVVNMAMTTVTFNATRFSVPWVNTVPLDGNYTLEVTDAPNNETIAISALHLTLNGQIVTPSSNLGNVVDQNADGTSGQTTGDNNPGGTAFQIEAGDNYVVGQPTGFTNYATGTLPIIVPGPHLSSTSAINSSGAVISTGPNNLVLNNSVSGVQVTWDRNILVSSFTPAQILSLIGPGGSISTLGITIVPVSVFTAAGQVAYSNGATADVFDIEFPAHLPEEISGTYTVTLGTGIVAADGSGVDANENAGLDVLRGTATNGVTTPVTYAATTISGQIPMTIAPAGVTGTSMTTSLIPVPLDFPIQPDTAAISGITLTLNITYPHDPDLTVFLVSPQNTMVELFGNVGAGTNTANFTNTTLSDVASTLIFNAGAPFFGTFLPSSPWSNFVGEASLGNWELLIENSGNASGTLNSWSLTFQKPVSSTGLAEFPDDQSHTSFQIFNLNPSSHALANSTWTAVGSDRDHHRGTTVPVVYTTAAGTAIHGPTIPAGTVAVTPGVLVVADQRSPTTSPIQIQADSNGNVSADGRDARHHLHASDPRPVRLLARSRRYRPGSTCSPTPAAAGSNFTETTVDDTDERPAITIQQRLSAPLHRHSSLPQTLVRHPGHRRALNSSGDLDTGHRAIPASSTGTLNSWSN